MGIRMIGNQSGTRFRPKQYTDLLGGPPVHYPRLTQPEGQGARRRYGDDRVLVCPDHGFGRASAERWMFFAAGG